MNSVNLVSHAPAPCTSSGRKKSLTLGGQPCTGSSASMRTESITRTPLSALGTHAAHDQVDPCRHADDHADRRRYAACMQPLVDEPPDETPERHSGEEVSEGGPRHVRALGGITFVRGLVICHDARTISASDPQP